MKTRISFFICCTLLLLSGYLFYEQYWQWRSCFNAEGNCFDIDSATVYHAQSGMVWGGLILIFLGLAVFTGRKAWGRSKGRPQL